MEYDTGSDTIDDQESLGESNGPSVTQIFYELCRDPDTTTAQFARALRSLIGLDPGKYQEEEGECDLDAGASMTEKVKARTAARQKANAERQAQWLRERDWSAEDPMPRRRR